jgi:hypothetical protein
MAETVVGNREDAEDYKAFEVAITSDYCAETAVARELVLRLGSLICAWISKRSVSIAVARRRRFFTIGGVCHSFDDAGAVQEIVSFRFGVERIGVVIWGGRIAAHDRGNARSGHPAPERPHVAERQRVLGLHSMGTCRVCPCNLFFPRLGNRWCRGVEALARDRLRRQQ